MPRKTDIRKIHEPDHEFLIGELGKIINRMPDTIRKWEREGWLPEELISQRNEDGWRYWTADQIYGKNGIIAWMQNEDMRPSSNFVNDKKQLDLHLERLRAPKKKYLSEEVLKDAKDFAKAGFTVDELIMLIYPRTGYSDPDYLEVVLRKIFNAKGWKFPTRRTEHLQRLNRELKLKRRAEKRKQARDKRKVRRENARNKD
jgi:hypothetical protein